MSGSHNLRELLNSRCNDLYRAVDYFRTLLPHASASASVHSGEEGQFVEKLLAQFLRESLPNRVVVGTGFVVDLDKDAHSGQIDLLVYDAAEYAPYLRYGDAVVVPRQAVVAAISVKKNLRYADITAEAQRLSYVGSMCGMEGEARPYLCVFAFDSESASDIPTAVKTSFEMIEKAHPERPSKFSCNELIDSLIVLNKYFLKKTRWRGRGGIPARTAVKYRWTGGNTVHRNIYLQELLHGVQHCLIIGRKNGGPVLSTGHFPSVNMGSAGTIDICCEDRPFGIRA